MENDEALYQLEVSELTELFNTELIDLRSLLVEKGVDVNGAFLVSYAESEEEEEFGLLLTADKKIIRFIKSGSEIILHTIDKVEDISKKFPQILVALKM